MQTITQTLLGAQTLQFNINGKYFTILATTLGLNVRFYRGGKKLDLGDIKGLLAGLEVSFDANDSFDRIEIDTLGADTFVIGLSNGQSRYNRSQGNVNITNTPAVTISGNSQTTALYTFNRIVYGSSYKSNTNQTVNTPDVIVAPASNVNGLILHSANFWTNSTTTHIEAGFVAKNSTPATEIDGDLLCAIQNNCAFTNNYSTSGKLERDIFISSGKGLYFALGAGLTTASCVRMALYTIL